MGEFLQFAESTGGQNSRGGGSGLLGFGGFCFGWGGAGGIMAGWIDGTSRVMRRMKGSAKKIVRIRGDGGNDY